MREDRKIKIYEAQKKKACLLYRKTGDESHLEDVLTFRQKIEIENTKGSRLLSWIVFWMVIIALIAPFVGWFFR